MKILLPPLLLLSAGALAAQATLPLSGTASSNSDLFFLIDVDFGSAPQSVALQLQLTASGSPGLRVSLIDLDARAENAAPSNIANGISFGTNPLNLTLTTDSYFGAHQMLLQVNTNESGTTPFSGTLESAALATGAITLVDQLSRTNANFEPAQLVFDRAIRYGVTTGSATPIVREFDVDFGATAQVITFMAEFAALGDASFEIRDVTAGGSTVIASEVHPGFGTIRVNPASPSASGVRRLSVRIEPVQGGIFGWTLIFPQTVSVTGNVTGSGGGGSGGGGGGGGGSSGGCALQAATPFTMLLPAILLAGRYRGRRRD